jgi:hypothetical protein
MNVVASSLLPFCAAFACAQTFTVVPAAYATTDANSYEWLAGASAPLRQQTLVGASHLQALVGHTLTALEFRRTAVNETYTGGAAHLTVTLSSTPRTALTTSATFAANVGPQPVQVFAGTVTLPTSPATAGPGTSVAWTPQNTVRIAFTTPFVYPGGTLLVDIEGQPIPGQQAQWWMTDAVFEDIAGTVTEISPGCCVTGGPQTDWSWVAKRSLVLGGTAQCRAYGPIGSVGFAVFGAPTPPVPLGALGLPAASASCVLGVWPIDVVMVAPFEPVWPSFPFGDAEVRVTIPNHPGLLGASMATQWFEPSQMVSSNTLLWTIAPSAPVQNLTLVEGHPAEAEGTVSVHLAQVLRFESQ